MAFILIVTAWSGGSWGQPRNVTRDEIALLPSYCRYTQASPGYGTEGTRKWTAIYGDTFQAMHHYCWGFVYLMRADRHSTPEQMRGHMLTQAFGEIAYTIEHAPRTHALMPEMLTKQGMIMRRLKKPKEAIPYLEEAAELDPKYWRAYSELAQCHSALNDKETARQVLERGLALIPDSKVLKAMLQEMGGGK